MLVLPATITTREARDTQRMLSQALQRHAMSSADSPVAVDASGLHHFDSAALAVLLECQRVAQAFGKAFVVRHPPAKLIDLARLYGVDALLMQGQEGAASAA